MNDSFDDAATLPPARAEVPRITLGVGDVLGSFRIIRLLGRGGMGEVYEVEHTGLDKRYALKLLPPDFARQPGAVERFRREAKVMAHLEQPHIIQVDDSGETNGRYWLRMALAGGVDVVRGEQRTRVVSLQELADAMDGKLPADTLADLLRQILDGLAYAHAHGVIHRNLKPGNILLSQVGGKLCAKISDFGLVKLVGEEWLRTRTAESVRLSASLGGRATLDGAGQSTRSLVGTYEYMSPEQKRGEETDARSDLYAIGLITFRLLTGRQEISFELPSQIDRDLSPAWDKFVTTCLKPDRNQRVADCAALLNLLAPIQQQPFQSFEKPAASAFNPWETETPPIPKPALEARVAAPEVKEIEPQKPPKTRNPKIGMLVLATGLLILGIAGYMSYQSYSSHPASRPQPAPASKADTPTWEQTTPVENSLGMKFASVPGTEMTFSIWLTRVQDFEAFVKATGHDATKDMYSLRADGWKQRGDTWKTPGFAQGPTHPVCGVSWEDAKAFCKWLTEKERATGLIAQHQEYRLPKDWEWSVAVDLKESRNGTPKDKDQKITDVYPWGREWPPPRGAGNFAGEEAKTADWSSDIGVIADYNDGYPRTSPVGSFKANQYGLFDMSGNLWELCEDPYDKQSESRVGRGGSWRDFSTTSLISSSRINPPPDRRISSNGFRVVLGSSAP